uniref:hypothetical protein n=1 Tax=Rhizobium sp. F40D2 TaxID=3453141 RepID=UPI003F29C429
RLEQNLGVAPYPHDTPLTLTNEGRDKELQVRFGYYAMRKKSSRWHGKAARAAPSGELTDCNVSADLTCMSSRPRPWRGI